MSPVFPGSPSCRMGEASLPLPQNLGPQAFFSAASQFVGNGGISMATLTAPAFYGEAAKPKQHLSFIIAASSCGTLIEWYDFYLYGVLAGFFGTHFFPGDMKQGFLYSLGIFWTGFVVRPFGAVIFGHLGDLIGRKYTFMLTLGLMGLATFLVGCLPTYESIGWLAPALLVACRVVQGLALGGEYGGAATYVAEHAPDGSRGFYTSWIQTTATMGIVMALLAILAFRVGLGDAAFSDYGWRFPFLLSAVLVILSGYIRLKLAESPLFARLKEQGKTSDNPARDTYTSGRNWGLMLLALFGFTAPEGVIWYTSQFYALAYMQTVLWMGEVKDNPVLLCILVWYMVILVTMVYGPIAAFLVELFPARIRYSSMSLPYHIGNGVFGGGVPFIATFLAGTFTGIPLVGLLYPMTVASLGVIVSTLGLRHETRDVRIWDEVGGAQPLVADQI